MKVPSGGEDRKKMFAAVGGVLVAVAILSWELRDPNPPRPVAVQAPVAVPVTSAQQDPTHRGGTAMNGAPSGRGGTAKVIGTTAGALDPTLHMEAMLVTEAVEYAGNGRNIFSATSVPVVAIAAPVAAARPDKAAVEPPKPVPCPPNCPPPPPPPPIPLKFFGVVTSADGVRKAFLLHDDDVILAVQGDVVLRRYKVVTMSATSIQVEDMTSGNKQAIPLQVN
jgi:hypothetical protein